MKKIYVVTVFNSLNSGSFLQATSLYRAISDLGYEVSFLDTGARNLWKQASVEFVYMLKNKNFAAAFGKYKQAIALTKELKRYNRTKIGKLKESDENVFILGSDEIWNVARKDMAKNPIFWGKGLNMKKCISYAPSINNAKEEHLKQYDFVKEAMDTLFAVSVRDHYSFETLRKITDRDIIEVCDPTLLVDPHDYYDLKSDIKIDNYILVYMYAKAFSKKDVVALKEFAKEKGKKLVAFGSNFKWCDLNVNGTPWDFLSYIEGADYVCTGTFHGTLFSALFKKRFVVVENKNKKVAELLAKFGLSERQTNSDRFKQVLENDYDTEKLSNTLLHLRSNGLHYLKESIERI